MPVRAAEAALDAAASPRAAVDAAGADESGGGGRRGSLPFGERRVSHLDLRAVEAIGRPAPGMYSTTGGGGGGARRGLVWPQPQATVSKASNAAGPGPGAYPGADRRRGMAAKRPTSARIVGYRDPPPTPPTPAPGDYDGEKTLGAGRTYVRARGHGAGAARLAAVVRLALLLPPAAEAPVEARLLLQGCTVPVDGK